MAADRHVEDLHVEDLHVDHRHIVAAAAVVDDLLAPSRLLACRRSAPAHLRGGWEFPGGKVEPGESVTDAVRRELAEELGLSVELGEQVAGPAEGLWPLTQGWGLSLWWAVTPDEPTPLEDHDALRWLRRAELYDVPWLPLDLPAVAKVGARMSGNGDAG